jgi:hypothetical protein
MSTQNTARRASDISLKASFANTFILFFSIREKSMREMHKTLFILGGTSAKVSLFANECIPLSNTFPCSLLRRRGEDNEAL